jgi:glutathione S-transferase
LRSSLPMNLRFHKPGFTVWSSAQADIDRITSIWRDCLNSWKGPYLFGKQPTIADCMYAPVVTRFISYDVAVDHQSKTFMDTIMRWAPMKEWIADSLNEPQEIIELDLDF